jgi:hypothetical protein
MKHGRVTTLWRVRATNNRVWMEWWFVGEGWVSKTGRSGSGSLLSPQLELRRSGSVHHQLSCRTAELRDKPQNRSCARRAGVRRRGVGRTSLAHAPSRRIWFTRSYVRTLRHARAFEAHITHNLVRIIGGVNRSTQPGNLLPPPSTLCSALSRSTAPSHPRSAQAAAGVRTHSHTHTHTYTHTYTHTHTHTTTHQTRKHTSPITDTQQQHTNQPRLANFAARRL